MAAANKSAARDESKAALGAATLFPPFRAVRLRTAQTRDRRVFPAGARGVVVDVYTDDTYGVEFSIPAEDVIIVRGADLSAA